MSGYMNGMVNCPVHGLVPGSSLIVCPRCPFPDGDDTMAVSMLVAQRDAAVARAERAECDLRLALQAAEAASTLREKAQRQMDAAVTRAENARVECDEANLRLKLIGPEPMGWHDALVMARNHAATLGARVEIAEAERDAAVSKAKIVTDDMKRIMADRDELRAEAAALREQRDRARGAVLAVQGYLFHEYQAEWTPILEAALADEPSKEENHG